jgi:hypothetical protein
MSYVTIADVRKRIFHGAPLCLPRSLRESLYRAIVYFARDTSTVSSSAKTGPRRVIGAISNELLKVTQSRQRQCVFKTPVEPESPLRGPYLLRCRTGVRPPLPRLATAPVPQSVWHRETANEGHHQLSFSRPRMGTLYHVSGVGLVPGSSAREDSCKFFRSPRTDDWRIRISGWNPVLSGRRVAVTGDTAHQDGLSSERIHSLIGGCTG